MLILALESSAKAASVALCRDGVLIAQSQQCSGLTHSCTLLPMAEHKSETDSFPIKFISPAKSIFRIGITSIDIIILICFQCTRH